MSKYQILRVDNNNLSLKSKKIDGFIARCLSFNTLEEANGYFDSLKEEEKLIYKIVSTEELNDLELIKEIVE